MTNENINTEEEKIDSSILKLLEERLALAGTKTASLPAEARGAERKAVADAWKSGGNGKYLASLLLTVQELAREYRREHAASGNGVVSSEIKSMLKNSAEGLPASAVVACMGTEGAYAQTACDRLFKAPEIMYFKNFDGVFHAVDEGLCEYGILPIDNTTAGTVDAVYDLMKNYHFCIVKSLRLQVRQALLAMPGVKKTDIREVFSHEQGLRQCSKLIRSMNGAGASTCESTASAAKYLAESGRMDAAAIASSECALLYGLNVLESDVQDSDYNYTRFICISKKKQIFSGANKISLMAVLPHRPGSLNSIISKFAAAGVNLTKLESRPMPGREFEYMFYFDFDASAREEGIPELLDELASESEKFIFLGNYTES